MFKEGEAVSQTSPYLHESQDLYPGLADSEAHSP